MTSIRPLVEAAPVASPGQFVQGEHWRITVISAALVRIEWSDDGGYEDRASTFAIARNALAPAVTVERVGEGVVLRTGRLVLRYDGRPFSAAGLSVDLTGSRQQWRYGEPFPNLGGTTRTLDEVDGRTDLADGVLSREGIAVVDDSESFLFDDTGWIAPRIAGRRDLYVFAFGTDHQAALAALYDLSGHPAVLPRWALGNWWSRYHPYSDTSYLALMDRFEGEDLPFSVAVIDMDWHRVATVPERFGTGWTGYSWEPSLFPDPPAFLAALHARGLRATLNLHPADGVRAFEDAYPRMARRLGLDPATEQTIPFDITDRAFVEAYLEELHHPLEEQGVDFWWIDWQQGEHSGLPGVDPLWVLNHVHHVDALREGGTGMTFSRYAGPGSHRYAVGFSGDAVVSWASLAFQPEFTASAANVGYGWWSHDIGGHIDGIRDDQLATRWVQFGVFSPIMRLHSASNPFIRKEPWEYPPEHREAMSSALRFRHRLVPYLHSMNHRAAAGVPLVRPMYHLEPDRDEAYEVPNQYAFGTELVVAPIVEPIDPVTRRGAARAWLPAGGWTDVFTGTRYTGERFVELHRDLDSIPVLLRDGGVLPLTAPDALDATVNPAALEVLIAPAVSGTFMLVEDDVDRPGSRRCRTLLVWDAADREFRITATHGDSSVVPHERTWTVTFFGAPPTTGITDGNDVALSVTPADDRWSVSLTVPTGTDAVLRLGDTPVPSVGAEQAVHRLLASAQTANNDKVRAWEVITADRPAHERIAALQALQLPGPLAAALIELLGTSM